MKAHKVSSRQGKHQNHDTPLARPTQACMHPIHWVSLYMLPMIEGNGRDAGRAPSASVAATLAVSKFAWLRPFMWTFRLAMGNTRDGEEFRATSPSTGNDVSSGLQW